MPLATQKGNTHTVSRNTMFTIKLETDTEACLQELLKDEPPSDAELDTFIDWSVDNKAARDIKSYGAYPCEFCPAFHFSGYELAKHNAQHARVILNRIQIYQCHHCEITFATKSVLTEHINQKHSHPKRYKCQICKKKFTYKTWHEHTTTVHRNLRLKCKICRKRFKCQRYLNKHTVRHYRKVKKITPDNSVQCEKCGKSFKNSDLINKHNLNVHSSGMFRCTNCPSYFKCAVYLATHMRRVHYNDGRVHKCDVCNKILKSPRAVRIHKKNIGCDMKVGVPQNSKELHSL